MCGYDDFRFATLCQPQLTTYRVNVEQMAEVSIARIAQRIRKEQGPPLSRAVPGQLVIRESSGTAAAV